MSWRVRAFRTRWTSSGRRQQTWRAAGRAAAGALRNGVELCLTPTYASWAKPIEAQFGPLRGFVMGNSNHPNHTVLARELQAYLRWRNANVRHPGVLEAQRRERASVRAERQQRRGQPRTRAA